MNKNLKNGLMVGGGVLLAYWIWKSMQPATPATTTTTSTTTTANQLAVMPSNTSASTAVGQVGVSFSGIIDTDPVVGKRVW